CWTTLRLDCAAVTPANGRRSPHRTDFATDCCKVSACCGGQLVEKRQRGPLSQTSLCDLERAAEESLDAGEDRRSGEECPRARAVDAEVRRDLPDRSFRELAQGGLELALAELRADDAAKRTRRAAGCEHAERKRRRELGQRVRDNLPRGGDLRLIRRGAPESATRQPERTDLDPARPPGAAPPRASVPTTSGVEPPPTSQTATVSGRAPAAEIAPCQASAPSSSALRMCGWIPVASSIASTSSVPLTAWRPGEVTRISTASHASLRARRTCVRAAAAASSSFSLPIDPPVRTISSPSPSCRRSSRSGSMRPSPLRLATSRRRVFAPTSTIPTRTAGILRDASVGVVRRRHRRSVTLSSDAAESPHAEPRGRGRCA